MKIPRFLGNASELVRKVFVLARPYGRAKLLLVTGAALAQGLFQVLGVTSIFPFLALAADPGRLRNSNYGRKFLEWLPPMDDGELLLFAGIFAIVMLVLSNVVNLAAEFLRNRYAYGFAHWLRQGLLRKIVSHPYEYFLQESSVVMMRKVIGDVMLYTQGVLLPILDSFARIVTIFFLLVALLLVQPQIALFTAFFLGLFYLLVFRMLRDWRSRVNDAFLQSIAGYHVECRKLLDGIKAVKVHAVEEEFLRKFTIHSSQQARLAAQVPVVSSIPRYLIEPIAFGALTAIVLIYSAQGQDLLSILPNLGVIALAGYRLLPAFQLLYAQMTQLTTSRYALDEVYDEMLSAELALTAVEETPSNCFVRPALLTWQREIRLENVSFAYPRSKRAVIEDMNLVVPKNSSLGIIGETGSGKSTLVDLILGLHIPTAGRIIVDDTVLEAGNRRAWRAGIGYVPQDIFLVDDSIMANVAFGVPEEEIDREAVLAAIEAAQIRDFVEKELPQGLETKVGERGVRLSGGQRQRIGLARALYRKPGLLILDEATSALDVETEAEVMNAIRNLQGSVTMLIIAHRLTTVEGCDRRLVLGSK